MKRLEMVLASSIDQIQMDIALRYLVGLFTVDFTPLWEQGRQTLMLLVSKHLDKFWDIIFPLLGSSFNIEEVSQRVLLDAGSENGTTFSLKWECPLTFERHIQKMTSASYQAVFGRELSSLFGFAKSLKTVVMPLNCKSYFQQLLGLLEQLPSLIERKSDELVPLFFALTEKGEMDVETSSVLSGSLRRSHLLAFLKVFSKVKHPKKLHESEKLYSIFSELLANGEHKIQALALDCVLTWKEPTIIAHVDQLKDLTQDEKYSDAMLSLDIPGLYSSYTPEGRAPFMKVFLQILYGKLISRSGRGSSTHGLKSRRKAIFGFIATLSETDIAYIIDFMLDPYIGAPRGEEGSRNVDRRHRLGFLNLLEDAIAQLKTKITPFLPLILRAILLVPQLDIDEDEEEEGHDDDQEEGDVQKSSKDRQIYSLCIHRIKEIFSLDVSLDYTPFIQDIFKIFINDRIAKLHTENTQAPSALLQLFLAWSRNPAYATLLVSQSTVLFSNIIALVSAKKANESVVSLSLTIIENIQDILDAETEAGEEHSQESRLAVELKSMFPSVIDHISLLFSGYLSNGVSITLGRGQEIQLQAIRILSGGIKLVGQSENAVKIIRILFPLVKKPEKQVSEKIKEDILKIFVKFLHIIPEIQEDLIRSSYYGTVSQLYSNMMSRKARSQLQDVFFHFQQRVPSLKTTYDVLGDLNSFNQRRIDEPDFQRQFLAFGKLIDNQSDALSPDHWLPIVHNLLYLIQNTEEFASRNSSSHILQVLSQMAAKETLVRETTSRSFLDLIIHIVFPAIKKGLKNKSEVVRAELVTVLGVYVKNLPLHNSFRDMVPLLGGDNEEANFFMNIYHLQSHRRVRALRDLTAVCSQGLMASSLVSTVFIPILSHFVFESDRVAEHNFINEAIIGIRGCAAALSWGHYHALIRRFMNALEKRPDLERVLIRIIVQILDAFHFDVSSAALGEGYVASTVVNNDLSIISAKDEELNDEVDDTDAITPDRTGESEKISRVVTEKLLPSFVALLPEKDDEKVPARAPIALAIAKLLLNFPPKIHDQELARLLTKLCAILRSHLQDTRNSARDTLIQIAIMWGSKVTGQVICQLQSALRRDYQLHVLSYTLHSLITQVAPFLKVGDLDSVMANISSICIEDVFGASAQEKEVEALKGKMKEMKGTKSFDTLELISKMIGLGAVGKLLLPIREIMLETSDSKNIANMKEVFRRVAVGLSRNEGLLTKDVLTFIHELLTENLSLLRNDSLTGKKAESNQERTYKVRMKRAQVGDPMKNFSANSFLFVEFGLSIMLSILRSDNVSFKENNLLEMMAPFVEVLGTLLYSPHDSVTAQTMRVFCIIIKLPIDKMEGAVPVVLKRIFSIVRKSSTLETELLQVSFRLLTIIIRDCHSVDVTHKQLGVLLELIRPDLEQPDRQAVVFSMIKAILSRKLVLPEIYSLMDEVCRVMVTNQTDSIRSLCQQKFLQFILDYPHVEAKLQQQVNFVIKGLSYEHESGRITVLELLNDLLSHFSTEVLAKFSDIIFMALAMNLVNDDSAKCRELTSLVMRALFKKVSAEKLDKLMTLVDSWLESDAQPLLHRVSVQVYGLVIDSLNDSCKRHVDTMLRQLSKLLGAFLETYKAEEEEEESVQTLNWELGYYSLNSLSKLFTAFPEKMNQEDIWESVFALLPHPHSWIRNVACKLYGQLFSALDPVSRSFSTGKNGDAFGIVADEKKLKGLVSKFFVLLDSANLKPALAVQLIKNLIFISRCLLSLLPEILPVATEDDTDEPKDSQPGLLWLVKKMNRLARQESSRRRGPLIVRFRHDNHYDPNSTRICIQRQTVFQLFAATFPMVPSLYVSPCLEMMLETLYRVRNDETLKGEGMGVYFSLLI